MKKALIQGLILVLCIFALSGCQFFDTVFNGNSTIWELSKNTTPYVATTKSVRAPSSLGAGKSFESGSPTYGLFSIFREYVYPEDEGIIDTGNIYKLLFEASQLYAGKKSSATGITAAKIESPFDFGTDAEIYDHAYNDKEGTIENGKTYYRTSAYREDGKKTYAILGYTVEESIDAGTKIQRQIFLTSFGSSTGDIELEFATYDDKPNSADSDFGRRFYVEGNANDHTFFCQEATEGTVGVWTVVGKGVSKGTGYYILCIPGTNGAQNHYYRLPADATEADYRALKEAGSAREDLDDPNGYATSIEAYLKSADFTRRNTVPESLEDFKNDGFVEVP